MKHREYTLTCIDCNKAYVGLTGRSQITRYKEHVSMKYNIEEMELATHTLHKRHQHGIM